MPVACSSETRPITSAAPRCTCTGVQCRSARAADGDSVRDASNRAVGPCAADSNTQSPREMPFSSTQARVSAQRGPATPRSAARFCAWMLRTRTSQPGGDTSKWSPTPTLPENTVPVTTVPLPESVKQRSTARRKQPSAAPAGGGDAAMASRCARSAGTPSPVMRSEEHTSELQSRLHLVCRLLLEKKKKKKKHRHPCTDRT